MRIGIVPILSGGGGGIYQYSLTMLHTVDEIKSDGDEFTLFANDEEMKHPSLASLSDHGWIIKSLKPPLTKLQKREAIKKIIGEGPHRKAWRTLRRQIQLKKINRLNPSTSLHAQNRLRPRIGVSRWFEHCGIKLMLYPFPNVLSFETGIPYVMAIHDLQHRLQPEFPEVSANGEWESREYLFRNGTCYATLLLADSEVGKEDILNFYGSYGVTPDQVKVLPFLPASYLGMKVSEGERQRVRITYHLPERYLFYPAQFWPHKNHARIIKALGLIKERNGLRVHIVFCGSYTGEIREHAFREAMSLSHQLGVEKQVHYLGYVPDEDMSALYAEAIALVMPTFFGPTNIPVLEAWTFGCPVLTSDIRGIREQVGEAGILADPRSDEAIADSIYRLWTDESLCRVLIEKGRQRLETYTPDDYRQRLKEILNEAKARISVGEQKGAKRMKASL